MIRNIIDALKTAVRALFGNWWALGLFLLVYLALLGAVWGFVTLGLSSGLQVALTFVLTLVAPALFVLLQALGVGYTDTETRARGVLKPALRNWWKLFLISLPLLLLWWGFSWGIARLEPWLMDRLGQDVSYGKALRRTGQIMMALRFLLLWLGLPLLALQLWISASLEGAGRALKSIGRNLLRAFSPRSVLTYLIGMSLFAVIPYYLFFTRTQFGGAWVEMSLLGARMTLALLFILFGWVITAGALAHMRRGEPVE
ncbi:MAG: hypothetical protein ACKV2V_01740 [Blastocatellia bacterium]